MDESDDEFYKQVPTTSRQSRQIDTAVTAASTGGPIESARRRRVKKSPSVDEAPLIDNEMDTPISVQPIRALHESVKLPGPTKTHLLRKQRSKAFIEGRDPSLAVVASTS